jgi:hypothetical protein
MQLPEPECSYGYPENQLTEILGDRLEEFNIWMSGQTFTLCDGSCWNYETMQSEETGHTHGAVVYQSDVRNFLSGGRIYD